MPTDSTSRRQVTRDSHYVPSSYLKRWAGSDGKLSAYRLVVKHDRVAEWRRSTPAGVGYFEHLYTTTHGGVPSDEVEQWLSRKFETPAEPVIERAVSGGRLTPEDWSVLIRFVACQDVRTPQRMLTFLNRLETTMPALLQETLEGLKRELEKAHIENRRIRPGSSSDPDIRRIPAKLTMLQATDPGMVVLKYQTLIGREAWLCSLGHLLSRTADVLHRHRWTILRSPKGMSWLTSDNPVIRLAYTSAQDYHFNGGWGRQNCEILLPIGPDHLLYAMVGSTRPPARDSRCKRATAEAIQRFIIENAHRMVFGANPDATVAQVRPRLVNAILHQREAEERQKWHATQLEAERKLRG